MRIGYACLTIGVPGTHLRTCTKKNAAPDKLMEIIESNLSALDRMLDYNAAQDIHLFRISSDIIPFGSSPVNTLDWTDLFSQKLKGIGEKARAQGIRLSMHPGQYTVLNSPDEDVVGRAIVDLEYHKAFLDVLGMGRECKLILHIGGVYGHKGEAAARFRANYRKLPESIKQRLVIENDDKLYTAQDVLEIGREEGIPVVFDTLHHQVNPSPEGGRMETWIERCGETWRGFDGPQKIHYSQQAQEKKPGSHSSTIYAAPFMDLYRALQGRNIDLMLEVKDKNLSAVKCINLSFRTHIKHLEQEWARYKYTVLERSPEDYRAIRELLKVKDKYPAGDFYQRIEKALETEVRLGNAVNAAQHVWGYFKDRVDEKEKKKFLALLDRAREGKQSLNPVKTRLKKYAEEYRETYILNSLYFDL